MIVNKLCTKQADRLFSSSSIETVLLKAVNLFIFYLEKQACSALKTLAMACRLLLSDIMGIRFVNGRVCFVNAALLGIFC